MNTKGHLQSKFDFLTFIGWWSQWAELKFHGAQSASCRILATSTSYITQWTSKNHILTFIFTLYFRSFLCINCDDVVLIAQNTWRRKVIKQSVQPWRWTAVLMTWRQSNATLTNQDVCSSMASLNINVARSIDLHRWIKPVDLKWFI